MWEKLLGFLTQLTEDKLLPFVLIFAVGVVLSIAAATGGAPQLHIPATIGFWRYATAVVGLLLILLSVSVLFLGKSSATRMPMRKWFGVSVHSPQSNTSQCAPIHVVLSMKKPLPTNAEMWIFTVRSQGKTPRYWPHQQLTLTDQTWQGQVKASKVNPVANRLFAVFAVGEDGQALIRHYKAAGEAINKISSNKAEWPGIETLTSDIVQLTDRIEVQLASQL
jgi:hypothetical protein